MSRRQYAWNKAGTLEFYAPEGAPDADGALFVHIGAESLLDSTGLNGSSNAILDTATEALTALAAVGESAVTVASTAAFVRGISYVLENEEGDWEPVTLRSKTATVLRFDQPIRIACAVTTSTIKGWRMSVPLTTTHTNTRRRYVEDYWEYAVDGITYQHSQRFDIVRRPFDLVLTEGNIELQMPNFGEYTGSRGGWKKHASAAVDDVWGFLASRQIHPDTVQDKDLLTQAAACRTLARWNSRDAEKWERLFTEKTEQFLNSKAWIDENEDGVADTGGGPTSGHGGTTFADSTDLWYTPGSGGAGIGHDETAGVPAKLMKVL